MAPALNKLGELILDSQVLVFDESSLTEHVALCLEKSELEATQEFKLDSKSRVDFLTSCGVAIELKVDGTANSVLRQLTRYAEHDCVKSILLVTTRSKHASMPDTLRGKPLRVCLMNTL